MNYQELYLIPSLCSLEFLRNTIEDIKDLSMLENKNFKLRIRQFNLQDLIL